MLTSYKCNNAFFFLQPSIFVGTYKLKKFNLQRQGYRVSDINKNGSDDKLFFLHPKTGAYESLTSDLYDSIANGLVRL